jgi:3'-phosphoadenosine 5'-phosphosulfate sulfotransferase
MNMLFLILNQFIIMTILTTLFFKVLAKKHKIRNVKVSELFDKVPYLNSSLFGHRA